MLNYDSFQCKNSMKGASNMILPRMPKKLVSSLLTEWIISVTIGKEDDQPFKERIRERIRENLKRELRISKEARKIKGKQK